MEQQYEAGVITVHVDGTVIQRMEQLDQVIYHTPGSSRVYIDSRAHYLYDRCVANVQDLLAALGYYLTYELTDEDVAELTFEV